MLHVARDPRRRFARHASEKRVRPQRQSIGVQREQGAVVVEHLLEVRHAPATIRGVAEEAAAEVVVDAAARHLGERRRHHAQGVRVRALRTVRLNAGPMLEQVVQSGRHRELRRRAEAAFGCIVKLAELLPRGLQQGRVAVLRFALVLFDLRDHGGELLALRGQFGALLAKRIADAQQQIAEAGQAVARAAREVGAGEERQQRVRIQERGERPAAGLPREQLVAKLVDAI